LVSEHGLAFYSAGVQLYRGYAHFQQGQHGRSIAEIEAGLAGWSTSGTRAYRGFYLSLAGLAHHHLGHASEALRAAQVAIQHVEETGERWFESKIRREYALLLGAAGDSRRARAELRRAIKVAREQGASLLLQHAITSLAELDARTGTKRKLSSTR
jgi:predicted ATPase